MGDRVSISFVRGKARSPQLFNHWGGREFVQDALKYARNLSEERKREGGFKPLDRLEPRTVMVDFIRYITNRLYRVESNLYICANRADGDDSDNGAFIIDLTDRDNIVALEE
jgi:hypothetical protein